MEIWAVEGIMWKDGGWGGVGDNGFGLKKEEDDVWCWEKHGRLLMVRVVDKYGGRGVRPSEGGIE